jgi:IS5 family transposase
MTRWHQRIGEKGVELLLKETIEAARCGNVVKVKSFEKVIVDTTVMEKAVANPTDSRLLERGWLPRQDVTPMPGNTGA